MMEEAKGKISKEGYTGGIIIDEMSIQSDLQICKNGDVIEMSGFLDIGQEDNLCYNLRKGKNKKILGTHALQFVFLRVNGFLQPISYQMAFKVLSFILFSGKPYIPVWMVLKATGHSCTSTPAQRSPLLQTVHVT
jgi:hypothetical protein